MCLESTNCNTIGQIHLLLLNEINSVQQRISLIHCLKIDPLWNDLMKQHNEDQIVRNINNILHKTYYLLEVCSTGE